MPPPSVSFGLWRMIGFLMAGDLARTSRFIARCQIASIGASMGGVETLIQQPALMSHHELTSAQRLAIGAYDNLVRLSVGLEDAGDLMHDLGQALAAGG